MKLITLNIEADHHLDRVIPFLQKEKADVVCLQEVIDRDVDKIKDTLGMDGLYVPAVYVNKRVYTNENGGPSSIEGFHIGLMLLTNKNAKITTHFYHGDPSHIPPVNVGDKYANLDNRILLIAEFKEVDKNYTICTTHFTWSDKGESTQLQAEHMQKMFDILKNYDEYVLCGDFNAPRGGATWQLLTDVLKDNIPSDITSTIDSKLHRVKNLNYVIDGIFSTPKYEVENVQIIEGLSDHKAIMAEITIET